MSGRPGLMALGTAGNAIIDRAYGEGEYGVGVDSNDIVEDTMAEASVPVTLDNSNGSIDESGDVVIVRREFITNVVASGMSGRASAFKNDVFPINPGLASAFPFVSQLAQNFTLYKIMGLIYQFVPMSGEAGGNAGNQLGKIIMATDYDPTASPFINSNQMENYQYSQSAKPSLGQRHGVECAKFHTTTDLSYIRTAPVPKSELRWTDQGLFQIASEGVPIPGDAGTNSTVILGELWVSYTIKLSRASLYGSLLGFNINRQRIFVSFNPQPTVAGQRLIQTNANPTVQYNNVGATLSVYPQQTVNSAISQPYAVTIRFPSSTILGTYKITAKFIQLTTLYTGAAPSNQGAFLYPCLPGTIIPGPCNGNDLLYATQWGCAYYQGSATTKALVYTTGVPFYQTAVSTSFLTTETYPNLNLQTGDQQWDLGSGSAQFLNTITATPIPGTSILSRCNPSFTASSNANNYSISETQVFYQVNAPSLTTAQLTMFMGNASQQPSLLINTNPLDASLQIPSWVDITIEQINGQTSAQPENNGSSAFV